MGDREEEAAFLRRDHVIAMEAEAERAEHLGPEGHRHAREPAEPCGSASIFFTIGKRARSSSRVSMKIGRPVRTISGPGAGRSIGWRLQPVWQARPGRSRRAPAGCPGRRRPGPSDPPASAPSASIAAVTVACATSSGVIARARTSVIACRRWSRLPARRSRAIAAARSSFAWRSLPEITPAPTDAISQRKTENWVPGSKSVTSGTKTRPPTRLTSAPAIGPQTIAAATERSAPKPPGTPSKLPGGLLREEQEDRDLGEDEARDPPWVPDPPSQRPGRARPSDRRPLRPPLGRVHRHHAPTSISNHTSLRSFVITPHRSAIRSTR